MVRSWWSFDNTHEIEDLGINLFGSISEVHFLDRRRRNQFIRFDIRSTFS